MGVGQGENNFSTFFNQVNCPSYRVCFYILTPTFWGLDKSKPVKLPLEPKKKKSHKSRGQNKSTSIVSRNLYMLLGNLKRSIFMLNLTPIQAVINHYALWLELVFLDLSKC